MRKQMLLVVMVSLLLIIGVYGIASSSVLSTGAGAPYSSVSSDANASQDSVITKMTATVKSDSGDVLVLDNGQSYSLTGVQVSRVGQLTGPGRKKVAQLYFLRGTLNKVVIHAQ